MEKRKSKKYELSTIDLRFLKVVDAISNRNKLSNIKPSNDSAISTEIFGKKNRTLIGKIRASHRGITLIHLEKFAIYFDLDCNCFFRDNVDLNYEPEKPSVIIKGKGQAYYGDNGRNIHVKSGTYNESNYHGTITKQIQNAKKIVNESKCSEIFQEKCSRILDNIENESNSLEILLDKQTDELKKMAKLHNTELKKNEVKLEKIKKERDEAREGERVALKKIVDFLGNQTK